MFLNIGSKILPLPDTHMGIYLGYMKPKQEKTTVKWRANSTEKNSPKIIIYNNGIYWNLIS